MQVFKRTVRCALIFKVLHRLGTNTFKRAQSIDNRVTINVKISRRPIHIRRNNRDFKAFCFLEKCRQLVSIMKVQTHGRGEESHGKMTF